MGETSRDWLRALRVRRIRAYLGTPKYVQSVANAAAAEAMQALEDLQLDLRAIQAGLADVGERLTLLQSELVHRGSHEIPRTRDDSSHSESA